MDSLAAPQDTCVAAAPSSCSLDFAALRSLAAASWIV
jgi:hypothetical protein